MREIRSSRETVNRAADAFFGALMLIQLLLWCFTNLRFRLVNDHDSAKVIYHTLRMWQEKTLLIPGWQYMTTAEWDCAALLAMPFYGLTGNILLSFALSNIVNTVLLVFVLLRLCGNLGLARRYGCLIAAAVMLPYGLGMLQYANMLFYSAAQYVYKVLLPLWLLELITAPEKDSKHTGWRLQACLFAALCLLTAVSSGLYVFLCGLFPLLTLDLADRLCRAGGEKRAGGPGFSCSVVVLTAAGYALQKAFGLSTYADEIRLVRLQDFLPKLAANFESLMELAGVLPSEEISLYTVRGIIYAGKLAFFIFILFRGLSALGKRTDGGDPGGLIGFAASALAAVFLWNVFVQQLTVTSARYHLIGFVPLVIAAGIVFAAGTERRKGSARTLRLLAAAAALLFMMAGCWHMMFSAIGNHFADYYSALTAMAEELGADSVAVINDSASAELARVLDADRTYVSYFTTNRSLVNYDADGSINDRSALSDRHLLVATQLGGLEDLPPYLRSWYREAGEVYGDNVYLSDTCRLDGLAGPLQGKISVDFPYTKGYVFDTAMEETGAFPAGEERIVLTSPRFEASDRAVLVTLEYAAEGAGDAAILEIAADTAGETLTLTADGKQAAFEVPAGETFEFSVRLFKGAKLLVERITFEER